ncbi:MAG: peptidoglycan DD-metalloendopeptidase family protein [Pseudomonadales bacterium]|nr:peptidoglycan DD-metalloendopeptidase family protein [Pseudomonadales bacterium]
MESTRAQLEALDERLAGLERWLASSSTDRDALTAALRESDEAVAALARRRREAETRVQTAAGKVDALRAEIRDLEAAEAEQAQALRAQLRAAWILSRRSPLQMLLEAETPDRVGRLLWFSRHTSEARAELVGNWQRARGELEVRAGELADALARLEADRDALRERAAELVATRRERGAMLADLERRIAARRDNVAELRATRAELEALLQRLVSEAGTLTGAAFEAARGSLPWPAPPRILQAFGRPRPPGGLPADGVFIAAEAGAPVRAVASGEVVFAEWLRGFGLLAVVDHGGGYMSLYGQLESLTHQVGDRVEAGEQLATAGRSGGSARSGLWFEVRNQGTPEDPVAWCAPRTSS